MSFEFLYILLISLAVGFIIGIEREIKFKPIGLRTFTFIVLSSSMLTYFSGDFFGGGSQDAQSRVLAALIAGFGFLGAGAIFKPSKGESSGLTTGSLVILGAVLGILIGKRYFIESLGISFIVLIILIVEGFLEGKLLSRLNRHR